MAKGDVGTLGSRLKDSQGYTTCKVCNRSMRKADVDKTGLCPDCAPPKGQA